MDGAGWEYDGEVGDSFTADRPFEGAPYDEFELQVHADSYVENVVADVSGSSLDADRTGRPDRPQENTMRHLEQYMDVGPEERMEYRREIAAWAESRSGSEGEYDALEHDDIREAVAARTREMMARGFDADAGPADWFEAGYDIGDLVAIPTENPMDVLQEMDGVDPEQYVQEYFAQHGSVGSVEQDEVTELVEAPNADPIGTLYNRGIDAAAVLEAHPAHDVDAVFEEYGWDRVETDQDGPENGRAADRVMDALGGVRERALDLFGTGDDEAEAMVRYDIDLDGFHAAVDELEDFGTGATVEYAFDDAVGIDQVMEDLRSDPDIILEDAEVTMEVQRDADEIVYVGAVTAQIARGEHTRRSLWSEGRADDVEVVSVRARTVPQHLPEALEGQAVWDRGEDSAADAEAWRSEYGQDRQTEQGRGNWWSRGKDADEDDDDPELVVETEAGSGMTGGEGWQYKR